MNRKQLQPYPNTHSQNFSYHSTSFKQIPPNTSTNFYQSEYPMQQDQRSFSPNYSNLSNYSEVSQGNRPRRKIFDPVVKTTIPEMVNPDILNQSFTKTSNNNQNNMYHSQKALQRDIHFDEGVQLNQQLGPSLLPKNRISEGESPNTPKIHRKQNANNFPKGLSPERSMHNYGDSSNNSLYLSQIYPPEGYQGNLISNQQRDINSFKNMNISQINQYPLHFDSARHPDLDTSYTSTATTKTSRRRIKPIVVMNINIGNGKKAEIQVFEGDNPPEVAKTFCQNFNLPPSLVQILNENIITQINNYYKLKEQKIQKSTNSPLLNTNTSKKNFETFVQDDLSESAFDRRKGFNINEEQNQLDNFDPRMSEKASMYQPIPHDYTPNPALKQSIQQNDFGAFEEKRTYKSPMDWSSPEKSNGRRKSFGINDKFSPEIIPLKKERSKTPTQSNYKRSESKELIQDGSNGFNVHDHKNNELQEIEEEIKKLKMKKQKLYFDKYKNSRVDDFVDERVLNSQGTKASIKDFETYQLESLNDYGQNEQNQATYQKNFDTWGKPQNQLQGSQTKSYLTQYVDEEKNKRTFLDKVIQEKNKKDSEERENSSSPNQKRNFSPQFQVIENKTHSLYKSNTSTTPFNSDAKNYDHYRSSNDFHKQSSQNLQTSSRNPKSFHDDPQRSSFRSNKSNRNDNRSFHMSSETSRFDELKKRVLDDIFLCLDNDHDGNIDINNVDISNIHPEILENLSEVFAALEDDMILTYHDFINMVNHKKLVEVFQKVYGSRNDIDSQRGSDANIRI